MLISDALELKERAFIALIGAGGKSSSLQILAKELIEKNKKIILTTTTKMFTDQITLFLEKGIVIESSNDRIIEESIKNYFEKYRNKGIAILLTHKIKGSVREKFSGPESHVLDKWWEDGLVDFFIVEADGARGKPIKAPSFNEPVIPQMTTEIIAIIGIDAVGLTLEEENVFRPHIFSNLTGLEKGDKINKDVIVSLINHPLGVFKNTPDSARKHLFFNKVNNKRRIEIAEEIAEEIFQDNQRKIENVIVGDTLQDKCPVIKTIKSKKI